MGNCFTNQCSPKPSSVVPVNQVSKVTRWRQLKNCIFQDKRTRGRVPGVVQLGENSAVTIRAITESRGREGSELLKERRSKVPEKADSKVVRGCLFCFGFGCRDHSPEHQFAKQFVRYFCKKDHPRRMQHHQTSLHKQVGGYMRSDNLQLPYKYDH